MNECLMPPDIRQRVKRECAEVAKGRAELAHLYRHLRCYDHAAARSVFLRLNCAVNMISQLMQQQVYMNAMLQQRQAAAVMALTQHQEPRTVH